MVFTGPVIIKHVIVMISYVDVRGIIYKLNDLIGITAIVNNISSKKET